MNPYEILGVAEGASLDEIKAAYREKARRYHPDLGGDAWAFRQIENAFALLSQAYETGESHAPPDANAGGNGQERNTEAGEDEGADIRVVAAVLVAVLIVRWLGWLGVFRIGLWLGLAATSGGTVYFAWSACAADATTTQRRKLVVLSIVSGVLAGVTFLLLALALQVAGEVSVSSLAVSRNAFITNWGIM